MSEGGSEVVVAFERRLDAMAGASAEEWLRNQSRRIEEALTKRGIPTRATPSESADPAPEIEIGLGLERGLRLSFRVDRDRGCARVEARRSSNPLRLLPSPEVLRAEVERIDAQRKTAALEETAYLEALRSYEWKRADFVREEAQRRARWDASLPRRKAALAVRLRVLQFGALAAVALGLIGAYLVFRAWDLSAYYAKTTQQSYGFLIIRLFVYVLPWAVMAAVVAAGIGICALFVSLSGELRDPSFSPGSEPKPPRKPRQRTDAPIDNPTLGLEAFCLGQVEGHALRAPSRRRSGMRT